MGAGGQAHPPAQVQDREAGDQQPGGGAGLDVG